MYAAPMEERYWEKLHEPGRVIRTVFMGIAFDQATNTACGYGLEKRYVLHPIMMGKWLIFWDITRSPGLRSALPHLGCVT
ncbi:hypothetical protein CFR74_07755 [Novacetimonas hansenii]|nr:hypothetical protein CFR74_07755 [Novacetimonas hansenii]